MKYTPSGCIFAALGTLIVIVGFFVALGAVVAQISICGPGGTCTEVDYLSVALGIGAGILVASGGGWLIYAARAPGPTHPGRNPTAVVLFWTAYPCRCAPR